MFEKHLAKIIQYDDLLSVLEIFDSSDKTMTMENTLKYLVDLNIGTERSKNVGVEILVNCMFCADANKFNLVINFEKCFQT